MEDVLPPAQAGAAAEGAIRCAVTYSLLSSGGLRADWEVDASEALPAPLAPGLLK